MRRFHSTYDEYYDAGVGEFPLPIRCVRNVALAIVWAFALCMARPHGRRAVYARSALMVRAPSLSATTPPW